jgi:glycosyltransferase involved in cell wall biosynthesis
MRFSVLIPAYNAADTIEEALQSVFAQTVRPHEILVVDDGSTDATGATIARYRDRVRYFWQANAGVASARNALCARVRGEVIAYLDADDVWHPRYLEIQKKNFEDRPRALACFTGHRDFSTGVVEWKDDQPAAGPLETWDTPTFLKTYNALPGRFANQSHCCVARAVFERLGPEPYRLRMAEDLYFFNRLPLYCEGEIVYDPIPLVAYRVRQGSLSADRLLLNQAEVTAFELLEPEYRERASDRLIGTYRRAFAIKRRQYAKTLLGAKQVVDGRRQLLAALTRKGGIAANSKTLGLLLASYLPDGMHPAWPRTTRASLQSR